MSDLQSAPTPISIEAGIARQRIFIAEFEAKRAIEAAAAARKPWWRRFIDWLKEPVDGPFP